MVIHICCKCLSPMFYLFSRRMLQVCLSGCCICFTHMLLVFYLHVAYVCNIFQVFFQVFQTHVSSVLSIIFLYVESVVFRCFKSRSGIAHEMHVEKEGGASGLRTSTQHG
jgi:hypothetical protein